VLLTTPNITGIVFANAVYGLIRISTVFRRRAFAVISVGGFVGSALELHPLNCVSKMKMFVPASCVGKTLL